MLQYLCEGVEEDTQFRIKAIQIVKQIFDEIKTNGINNFNEKSSGTVTYYMGTPTDLRYNASFSIIVRPKVKGMVAGYDANKNQLHIFLDVSDNILQQIDKMKGTLVHEVIHYFDTKRAGSVSMSSDLSDEDYHNHSFELNAFYQEIIFDLEMYISKLLATYSKSELYTKLKPFEQFYRFVENKFFPTGFKNNINEQNKKRIRKRLYQYHSERLMKELSNEQD